MIQGEVDEQVSETSMPNLPKTNVVEYLKFVADKLTVERPELDSHGSNCLQTISEDVGCVLNALVELLDQKESFQTLWDRAVQVGSRLDDFLTGDSTSKSIDSIAVDVTALRLDVLKVFDSRKQDVHVAGLQDVQLQSSSPDATTQIVGFKEEMKLMKDQLTSRGTKKLQVIAIVGMPGLGKTTLATKLYNDPTIVKHFHVRGWCSVSQELNQRKTFLELLNYTTKGIPGGGLGMSDHDLLTALWKSLRGKRYLILLDDLWDSKAWDILKASLPDDSTESRILVTSRYNDVVPDDILFNQKPHLLHALALDECWELLKIKLSLRDESPAILRQLGKEIAHSCWGLPLIVVIVAGLLTSQNESVWKEVLESLTSGAITLEEQCANTFRMSYNHLPHYLKPCFLYFGLFPEDNEISVKRLIWLWIAEGLVFENHKFGSLEDVASRFIMDLAGRSLVTVSEKGSMGGAKACRVHDLLRDFCITRAKEESFFHDLRWSEASSFKEPFFLPRLTIDSRKRDFKDLKLFRPNKQSLLFFPHNQPSHKVVVEDISFIILFFKQLRVLDVMQIDLGYVFPNEMELLARLRFLAVKGCFRNMPSSVGNLSKLETLIVHSSNAVTLPLTIWTLQKLRHLCIQNGFYFPVEDLDNCSGLYELESCSTAIISSWEISEKLMEKLKKIRRLKCRVFKKWDTENCNEIRVPDSLSSLSSLHVSLFGQSLLFARVPKHGQFEFSFPENLKKLTLDHFELPEREISTIGKLPNLEVLKLSNVAFSEGVFCMLSGDFLKLRFLKLSDSRIVRWATDDEYTFPRIEKFVLKSCKNLKEIPSCLGSIETLQMIEVMDCSMYVERAVERIKETQQEFENLLLKVLISQ